MADDQIEVEFDNSAMLTIMEEFLLDPMRNPRDNNKIRASTVGSCPRHIAQSILGHDKVPNDAHKEYTFWIGHALGKMMTFKLIKLGWVKATPFIDENDELDFKGNTEEEVEDKHFKGHYDIFTEPLKSVMIEYEGKSYPRTVPTSYDDPEGKRYLLDFKTMSDRVSFFFPKDSEGNPVIESKTPKKGGNDYIKLAAPCLYPGEFNKCYGIPKIYWEQIQVYARIKQADGVMLFVMAKDAERKLLYSKPDSLFNFPVKIFTSLGLDHETLQKLDEKAEYIYSFTNKNELPPIPEEYIGGETFPCPWCEHRINCFPDKYKQKKGLFDLRPIAKELL